MNHNCIKIIVVVLVIVLKSMFSMAQGKYPCETFKTPAGKDVRIFMISHGSIAISYDSCEIQIDPVGKNGDKTIDYSSFPKADFIFISHEHFDHLDGKTIYKLLKPSSQIFTNNFESLVKSLPISQSSSYYPNITIVKNGDELKLNESVMLKAVPAYNITAGHQKFHPKGHGNGFLFNFDGFVVYVSGDTEYIDEMKELGRIDVAFLSTNQPYTMTVSQCVKAAQTIAPKVLIPYHLSNTDPKAVADGLKNDSIKVMLFEELR